MIKRATILFLLFASIASANKVEINRYIVEGRWSTAIVTYTNTTKDTYDIIRINCVVYDKDGKAIATVEESLYYFEYGLFGPGFKKTFELNIPLRGAVPEEIKCDGRCREYNSRLD